MRNESTYEMTKNIPSMPSPFLFVDTGEEEEEEERLLKDLLNGAEGKDYLGRCRTKKK